MRKRILFLFLLLISFNQIAFGIPAYPFPVAVIQPDGTTIVIIQKGDEHVKWAQTIDGYSVMRNKSGIFEYATLSLANDMIPSGIQAKNQAERSSSDVQFLSNCLLYTSPSPRD